MNTPTTVDNLSYKPVLQVNAGWLKQAIWYCINILFFKNSFMVSSGIKVWLLRLFGAHIGKGVVIKPAVSIKYPWKLAIGNHSWIGENVWIDNLVNISIGNNVCISQGALLLTGNHNYSKSSFDLVTAEIVLEDGVWIGARSVVCPGVTCKEHSVLSVASVANKNMEAFYIYRGNPAIKTKPRIITT